MDRPSTPGAFLIAAASSLAACPLIVNGLPPAHAQCSMGSACLPSERFSPSGGMAGGASESLSPTQQGSVSFSETLNRSIGGASVSIGGASASIGGEATPLSTAPTIGASNTSTTSDYKQFVQTVAPSQVSPPSASSLHSRLHPALISVDGIGRAGSDGMTGSLWNSDSVLYKQDSSGAACSLNKQGPLISTCR